MTVLNLIKLFLRISRNFYVSNRQFTDDIKANMSIQFHQNIFWRRIGIMVSSEAS